MRFALYLREHKVDDAVRRAVENVVRTLCASSVQLEMRSDESLQATRLVSLDSMPERQWILHKPRYCEIIMAFRAAGVPLSIPWPPQQSTGACETDPSRAQERAT